MGVARVASAAGSGNGEALTFLWTHVGMLSSACLHVTEIPLVILEVVNTRLLLGSFRDHFCVILGMRWKLRSACHRRLPFNPPQLLLVNSSKPFILKMPRLTLTLMGQQMQMTAWKLRS